VKALPKPTAPAWALNQVFWRARAEYDRMIRAGDRLRDEQQQMLAGRAVDSREATQERQAAVRNVVERAAAFLADAGQPPTEAARQRLAVTADALATWGSRPEGYVPGRLERELDPPGFAALASLGTPSLRLVKSGRPAPAAAGGRVSSPSRGPGSRSIGPEAPAPAQDRDKQDAARAAREAARVREAERKRLTRALQDAEREAHRLASARERSAATLSRASADLGAAANEVAALERRLATARAGLKRAERVQADAAAAAAAAERACADAEDVAASAKRALEELAEE
jgi:hypothetical protein